MSKIVTLSDARTKRDKEREYRNEMNKAVIRKQKAIDDFLKRIEAANFDDETMCLFLEFQGVLSAIWNIGKVKKEYEERS